MMICVVATHDTGAYLVGKYLGKTPLAPTISPNKTWEGFIGGFLFSFFFSLPFFWDNPLALIIGSVLPLILSLNFASLAGDLFESMLKRKAGLKDAGRLLPGHGGILDRIDGLLFATIVVFLARNWIRFLLA
jgi:phosphatidate cytidylyltransferase